ncbi:MAG: alkaline phosphatase, partial [Porticoccaceae bacterium]
MDHLWTKRLVNLLRLSALVVAFSSSISASANNVILIIGDGMDDNQITIARNYLVGSNGKLLLDQLPMRSAVQVLSVDEDNPKRAIYVADSANSATSMATGGITSPGRIGTTAGADRDMVNIVELAKQQGIKVGLVTTASITDATPASFYAHVNERGCENPEAMVNYEKYAGIVIDCSQDLKGNGGLGSISEQLVSSGVDVALGGGMKHFTPLAEDSDETVLQLAATNGYKVISDAEQLGGDHGGKLLGLFSPCTMPVSWHGVDL